MSDFVCECCCCAWMQRIFLWGTDTDDLYQRTGCDCMWIGNTFHHNRAVFPVRHHGSFPRRTAWYGVFLCSHDIVCNRHGRDAYFMDLCIFPASQIPVFSVYLVSGVLAGYDHNAGDLLLFCTKKMSEKNGLKYIFIAVIIFCTIQFSVDETVECGNFHSGLVLCNAAAEGVHGILFHFYELFVFTSHGL